MITNLNILLYFMLFVLLNLSLRWPRKSPLAKRDQLLEGEVRRGTIDRPSILRHKPENKSHDNIGVYMSYLYIVQQKIYLCVLKSFKLALNLDLNPRITQATPNRCNILRIQYNIQSGQLIRRVQVQMYQHHASIK